MRYVWIALLLAVLVAEAFALAGPPYSDTLSHQVWDLRATWWGRALLVGTWCWLTWHWFAEPHHLRRQWADDVIVAGLSLLTGALLLRYAPWAK